MNKLLNSVEAIRKFHNNHIQDHLIDLVSDEMEKLECTSCNIKCMDLPDPQIYPDIKSYAAFLNEEWHCMVSLNGYLAFKYAIRYEFKEDSTVPDVYFVVQGMEDKRYFEMYAAWQILNSWDQAKDAIKVRMDRLVNITIPVIQEAGVRISKTLGLSHINYVSHDDEYIVYAANYLDDLFTLKLNDIGEIFRYDDFSAQSDRYFKVGELDFFYLFTPRRMRIMMEQDSYLQFVYSDLVKRNNHVFEVELRTLEVLFNSNVLDDSAMGTQYAETY